MQPLEKIFTESRGDYELPGFELRKNFGYCPAQEQEEVSEEEIRDALAEMGKFSPKDELNCGACGYNTCREKAIAIIQNKAEGCHVYSIYAGKTGKLLQ